ncbi:MAG: Smr/MutS family protein [Gammaproteobacteria bacterium]|nr:Smr/MutS family protein [Gammaproteobacteria bacterium]
MAKQRLSRDERALFQKAVEDVQPLAEYYPEPFRQLPAARRLPHPPLLEQTVDNRLSDAIAAGDLPPMPRRYCQHGVQPKYFRRFCRGELPIEAEIDLHGLHRDAARHRLTEFIHYCHERQWRVVRVIHGMGHPASGRGVIKQRLPYWLRQFEEVIAYAPAIPSDGGDGATYLLLRRCN